MNTPPPPSPADPGRPLYQDGNPPYGVPYYGGTPSEPSGLLGSLDPFRLLSVIRKKWLTIFLVIVFAAIAATYYIMTTSKVYKAVSLVELSVRRPRIMTQQAAVIEDQSASLQSEEIFNTRLEKFKGQTMRDAAIARYRKQYPACTLKNEEFNGLFANLNLTLLRRTRLVKIEFAHTNPRFAADFCAVFAETAEASVYDENRIASDAAVIWLEAQSVSQRTEVEKADAMLLKYRQENKIDALESQRKTVENALMDFNKVLVDLESQEAKERDLLNTLTAIELKPENVGRLPSSIPRGDEIKTSMDKWMAALAERDALLSKYTAKHPEVVAKDGIVALFRTQTLDALNRAKATCASNLDLFRKQAESLRQKKAEQAKLASDLELQIVERRIHLTALERTRDACDTAYRSILGRIQEARMASDENTATVKIVERPSVPEIPVKPRPFRIMALVIFLGIMGGGVLALITDTMEDHIIGPHDLEAGFGVKVLAMVPHADTEKRSEIATASMNQRFSQITEAFAGLRSMLDSSQYKDRTKVVLVAGSIPSEGKTITSCNLAIACAKNEQRVLLIDFDLRRPRLVGIFPMPPKSQGLLEYLSDTKTDNMPTALAYATDCPNLTVIASRPVKGASPAELVGSRKVVELIGWARQNYDRVIVDAPPLGLVSDALVLAGLSDCVLVMARPDISRKRATFHTIHRFREAGVRMIFAVFNDVTFASVSSYYSHYQAYPPENVKQED